MEKQLLTSSIKVVGRSRKKYGDISGLAASIKEVGLLQAIGVTKKDNTLIFGERRLRAYKKLGLKKIDCRILDIDNILKAEEAENEFRESLTLSEKHALAKKLDEEAKKTERRGGTGSNQYQKKSKTRRAAGNSKSRHQRETGAQIAVKAGFRSEREKRRMDTIVEKGSPELVEAVDKGDIPVTTAAEVAEKIPKKKQPQVIARSRSNGKVSTKKIGEALNPQRVTSSDRKSPYTASILWDKVMKEFAAFQGYAFKYWKPKKGTEPNYDAMLKSQKYDRSRIDSQYQVLESHIDDVQRLLTAMRKYVSNEVLNR